VPIFARLPRVVSLAVVSVVTPAKAGVQWLKPVIPAQVGIQCFRKSKSFHPIGRVTFLCWHKEKSPKESAFPDTANLPTEALQGFSDSPSWLGRKTAAIHGRRPLGLETEGWFAIAQKQTTEAVAGIFKC
jgi:hypothetical protein